MFQEVGASSSATIVSGCVSLENQTYITTSFSEGSCSLVILDPSATTAGLYTCTAPVVKLSASGQVVTLNSSPTITTGVTGGNLNVNQVAQLVCTVAYTANTSLQAALVWNSTAPSLPTSTTSCTSTGSTSASCTSAISVSSSTDVTWLFNCGVTFEMTTYIPDDKTIITWTGGFSSRTTASVTTIGVSCAAALSWLFVSQKIL